MNNAEVIKMLRAAYWDFRVAGTIGLGEFIKRVIWICDEMDRSVSHEFKRQSESEKRGAG